MRHNFNLLIRGIALSAAFLFFAGCSEEDSIKPNDDLSIDSRASFFGNGTKFFLGLSDQNEILKYRLGPPALLVSTVAISGLAAGETVLAIDFRSSNGALYGVTNLNLIYIIDPASGLSKAVSRTPFEPTIKGTYVGFDIDPQTDQIRLVTDEDQNMRISPADGSVISVDLDINPVETSVHCIAYNHTPINRMYSLFDIDIARGMLMKQDPQNNGTMTPVGSLGLVTSGEAGFDIARSNGAMLGGGSLVGIAVLYGHSLTPSLISGDNLATDAYRVYEVNLSSGKTTYRGLLPRPVIGVAIP